MERLEGQANTERLEVRARRRALDVTRCAGAILEESFRRRSRTIGG